MNFLNKTFKGGIGAALAIAIYGAITSLLVFGQIDGLTLIVNSIVNGLIFGLMFALVHIRREPTFVSSLLTGVLFVGIALAISLFAGAFQGFSVASVIALLVLALMLGSSSYAASRVNRQG